MQDPANQPLVEQPRSESQVSKPQATQKQFEQFITFVKTNLSEIEKVREALEKYHKNILNRLELGFRQPALYFAILNSSDQSSYELAKLLVSGGADPKHKDQNNQTVLFYACREGKPKCCELLMENGLKPNEEDMYGQTPLFYVASQNRLNLLHIFDNEDTDALKGLVNHPDQLVSQTALFYAATKGHTEMCKQLIKRGANVMHVDSKSKMAGDYAKKGKFHETAELLNQQVRRLKQPIGHNAPSVSMSAMRDDDSVLNSDKRKKSAVPSNAPRSTYKIVFMNEKGQTRDLTEQEVRNLVREDAELESYLSNPSSIPQEELEEVQNSQSWQKVAVKVLQGLNKAKGAYWFSEAVDPVKYNIMDYFDIVEKPMDLGLVKRKLGHNVYADMKAFIDDVNLVWSNCFKYNGDQHEISICAKSLEIAFNEELNKYNVIERFVRG